MTFVELLHLATFNHGTACNKDFMVTIAPHDCFLLCNADTELLAIVSGDSCVSFCWPDTATAFLNAVNEFKNL